MKTWRNVIAVIVLFATLASASAIKVWSAGDVFSFSDLNAALSHIHSTMVGGHGARLVDADVSASASLSHSKLATPGLIAKSQFIIGSSTTPCSVGTCTLTGLSGLTPTVDFVSTGIYTITWSVARPNNAWQIQATPLYCNASTGGCYCNVQSATSTTTATIQCFGVTLVGPVIAAANTVVSVVIYDNDN